MVVPVPTGVTKAMRAAMKGQHPRLLWFTGFSGAGKSTLAAMVESELHAAGLHTYMLDGDNLRHGLNRSLGFSLEDREENLRRVGECAKLLLDAGLIVLAAFISPLRRQRELVRAMVEPSEFVEIFVDTPLAVCEARDPKGLYRKAREGLLPDFTGVDSPYEPPVTPDIHIEGCRMRPDEAARRVVELVFGGGAAVP